MKFIVVPILVELAFQCMNVKLVVQILIVNLLQLSNVFAWLAILMTLLTLLSAKNAKSNV